MSEAYSRVITFRRVPVGSRLRYRGRMYRKIEEEKSISGTRELDNVAALYDTPKYRFFIQPFALVLVTDEVADAALGEAEGHS